MSSLTHPPVHPDASALVDEQIERFFDLAVDILAVAGLDGRFRRVSASVTETLGYPAEQVAGRAVLDMVHEQDRECVSQAFDRLTKGETVRDFRARFGHRDGSYRWLSWNASAPGEDGSSYMVGRDITAWREAEEQLRLTEQRVDLAVRGASDGLWDWIDLHGTEQWWSPKLYELLGLEDGEIPADAKTAADRLHPQQRELARRMLREHLRDRRPFDLTCQVLTKQGAYRWYRVRGAATRNEKGWATRMSGSLSDVTELLETMDRLKRSEQLLHATGALAEVGGWEIDAETLEVRWSPQVAAIHRLPADAEPDLNRCLEYYSPEARPAMRAAVDAALRHGEPWDLELPLVAADGRRIWVRSQGRADVQDGRVIRVNAALQNITARKEAKEQARRTLEEVESSRAQLEKQAMQLVRQAAELALARESAERAARLKGAFLATMSHEIRTPLNGVLGMVSLLEDTAMSGEQQEYLETIRVSGESLLEIINDVLDFSKTEAGKTELASIPFDLARCCEEAADMLAAKAAAKRLDLSVFVSPECPVELCGDPGRLRQVLANLIGNALKFTETGHITLVVEPLLAGRSAIRFEVRDTGIGISRSVLPNLFQPFTQADSGTTRRFGGTGLGLAICKQIVEASGGRIGAFSEPGTGATFWFELDLPVVKPPRRGDLAELENAEVLILARAPGLRASLERYFKAWGLETQWIDSVEKAQRQGSSPADASFLVAETGAPCGFPVEEIARLRDMRPEMRLAAASWPGSREIEQARSLGLEVLYRPIKRGRLSGWATRQTATRESRGEGRAVTPSLRVLVAEDNPVNQKIALKMLERLGHDATLAVNGREALERTRSECFDLILMDCQMPEMDGYQAAREVRRLASSPPIVALTANALEGDRQRCLDAGMDDYLSKPIDLAALGDMLARWSCPGGESESV